MMQDNRLLPLSSEAIDRPLRDLAQPAPVTAAAAAQEPAHLREYLAVVLKRKWLILSLMVVVTSLVAIQMYRMPSQYEAQATVQIEQKLKTQKLARQVILRLGLQDNPTFLATSRGTGIIAGLRRIITRERAQQPK